MLLFSSYSSTGDSPLVCLSWRGPFRPQFWRRKQIRLEVFFSHNFSMQLFSQFSHSRCWQWQLDSNPPSWDYEVSILLVGAVAFLSYSSTGNCLLVIMRSLPAAVLETKMNLTQNIFQPQLFNATFFHGSFSPHPGSGSWTWTLHLEIMRQAFDYLEQFVLFFKWHFSNCLLVMTRSLLAAVLVTKTNLTQNIFQLQLFNETFFTTYSLPTLAVAFALEPSILESWGKWSTKSWNCDVAFFILFFTRQFFISLHVMTGSLPAAVLETKMNLTRNIFQSQLFSQFSHSRCQQW